MEQGTSLLSHSSSQRMGVWLAFGVMFGIYCGVYLPFFPIEGVRLGHDYSYVFPALLDGSRWFDNNGFSSPWFTPSFCAGQPFFADPQSAYYALPQLISFFATPLVAVKATLLICASLMFWGGYLLMRRVFGVSRAAALLAAGLLMFNGFLPHRMIVGHTSFHAFALVPWMALLLLMPVARRQNAFVTTVIGGVLLAYWVHSGLGTLLVASGLAVLLLALLAAMRGAVGVGSFLIRAAGAVTVGLGLSAAKLVAVISLMSQLPRDFYPLPGAATIADAALMIAAGLFLPSQAAYQIGVPRLVNTMWQVGPHEWAYGFGMAPAVLGVLLLLSLLRSKGIRWPNSVRQWSILGVMLVVLTWPLAFSTWQADWNALLKSTPVLGSTTFPLRWIIVYIPFVAAGLGLMLDAQPWNSGKTMAVGGVLLATAVLSAIEPRGYYEQQGYDMRPVMIASERVKAQPGMAKIARLGTGAELYAGDYHFDLRANDLIVLGISQVFCYNPIFGYRLEKFSAEGLAEGDVLQSKDGYLNLKNPACYVFPAENGCRPGDRFRLDQIDEAKAFVSYRPFAFAVSPMQTYANAVTSVSFVFIGISSCIWVLWLVRSYLSCRSCKDL